MTPLNVKEKQYTTIYAMSDIDIVIKDLRSQYTNRDT
jgi:hypothetical protein